METIEILDEKEKEIVQPIMEEASDYTVDDLTACLKKDFQSAINSGKKISFMCGVSAVINLYTSIVIENQRKDFVLLTIKDNLEFLIARLKELGFPDLTKEEAEALISKPDSCSTSKPEAPVQQE